MKKTTKLKTGDKVVIRSGKGKGETGTISSINLKSQRVTIEGVNMAKKHQKPTRSNQAGGIIEFERPIHISNVGIAGAKDKPSRVSYKLDSKGNKTRVFAGTTKEIK